MQRTTRASVATVLLTAVLVAAPLTTGSVAQAGTPAKPTGTFTQTFREDFTTPAAADGPFAKRYANAWQPYPDGMGDGKYWSGSQVSAHEGVLDVTLDGKHGAAGTFGTQRGAWDYVGGTFTVRARATGGDGNGAAFIVWPKSNVWADGEMDFPEGNFDQVPYAFHHSMTPGKEASAIAVSTKASWRDWHTYSVQWIPGRSVTYSMDGRVLQTVTRDVATTPHRFMFQTGNWGKKGHLYIDWVTIASWKP
ncbi:glycoside hydrolase family 16 protein [Curtobacterium albidum]|uniref:Glycoside hydrolase family 16 protein n=1 Tax=Curtobacterium citreum TaxID=2036 RepID=A0A850DYD7_9MICO|nr:MULTISPECIES: glycoside hydrolase family 16 protein [Curtobacterium]MDK8170925.1 glycoside hydrolase family 16 protein [Curtobacterium citreum]NUU29799.1 glycoside hydrolase family 16 protein [Curtobacterium albidum]